RFRMAQLFGPRSYIAIGAAVVAAAGVLALSHNVPSALVALIGGVIIAMIALKSGDSEPATPAVPERPSPPATIGSVIEAIVEPVLIIIGGRVVEANAAAHELLGNHITGQDIRLAIRHPAAAERLVAPVGAAAGEPISLVGLGTLDQRWELRVTDIEGGR